MRCDLAAGRTNRRHLVTHVSSTARRPAGETSGQRVGSPRSRS